MAPAVLLKLLMMGLGIGALSGMLGIGGGVLVIPALVMVLGFTQQRAVGTSLAMLLPPIGLFAVLRYHRAGSVDWAVAMVMAAAFTVGALGGASLVSRGWVPERGLRVLFAVFLLYVAGNLLFRTERRVWAVLGTLGVMAAYGAAWLAMRALGRRWERAMDPQEVYRARLGEPVAPEYEI